MGSWLVGNIERLNLLAGALLFSCSEANQQQLKRCESGEQGQYGSPLAGLLEWLGRSYFYVQLGGNEAIDGAIIATTAGSQHHTAVLGRWVCEAHDVKAVLICDSCSDHGDEQRNWDHKIRIGGRGI